MQDTDPIIFKSHIRVMNLNINKTKNKVKNKKISRMFTF